MSISFAVALCQDWSFHVLGDGLRDRLTASYLLTIESISRASFTVAERHGSGNGASLCAMPRTRREVRRE
jgi:hypothetical protein